MIILLFLKIINFRVSKAELIFQANQSVNLSSGSHALAANSPSKDKRLDDESVAHVESEEPIQDGGNDIPYLPNLQEVIGLRPTLKA